MVTVVIPALLESPVCLGLREGLACKVGLREGLCLVDLVRPAACLDPAVDLVGCLDPAACLCLVGLAGLHLLPVCLAPPCLGLGHRVGLERQARVVAVAVHISRS